MDGNVAQWTGVDATAFAQSIGSDAKEPAEKRPLFRPLPPAPVFPIEALGPLGTAAVAIQHRTQAPMAIAAQSGLAAATLAVQAQRDVELPEAGKRPLTGIFVSVADSGERKSSVDRLALEAVYQVEKEWQRQAEIERPAYLNEKAAWDSARYYAKRAAQGNMATLRLALDQIGPEPKSPPHPMLLIADPTPEALVQHLADSRPMAGVFTAEGGLLIGGAAFSEESKTRTAALFNALWDGEPIRRRRIGTGVTYLPGRRCSTHIMLQPVVADRLFGDLSLAGIGLTARILLVAPDTTAGKRLFREAPPDSAAVLKVYNERIRYLLTRPPVTLPDVPDALSPPSMQLHPKAKQAWIKFHDHCERAIAPEDGPLSPVRAFGAKLAEHAARLAAVLTLYNDPDAMELPLVAMEAGITLATYYGHEMLRLHGGAAISSDLRAAEQLLTWWQKQPNPTIHLAMIYQFGPNTMRDAATAKRIVAILENHGYVDRMPTATEIDGVLRRDAWELRL